MTFYFSTLAIVSCFAGLLSQESVVDVAVSLGLNKLVQAINDTGLYDEWAIDGNNFFLISITKECSGQKSAQVIWTQNTVFACLTFRFGTQSSV